MASVRDSQKDLISETVSVGPGTSSNNTQKMFISNNSNERKLCGAFLISLLGKSSSTCFAAKIKLFFIKMSARLLDIDNSYSIN